MSDGSTVTNYGTVAGGAVTTSGTSGNGVALSGGVLVNYGSIRSGSAGSATAGLGVLATGSAATLQNGGADGNGTITGGVTMDNYANQVTLHAGSAITGHLNIGTSTSATLALAASGSGSQLYSDAVTGSTTFSGALAKEGTGTWTLDAALAPASVALNAGTLVLGHANSIGSAGTISFGGGTLRTSANNTTDHSSRFSSAASQHYAIDSNSQNVTLASALTSSGGSFTKSGLGSITLTGTNTYTGATTITAGLLTVNGDNSSSALTTVGAGATLGGSGTVGTLVVQNGATIAPGNSPGTLAVDGNVTWQAGGNYNWQLVDALGTAGTGWDTLAISGELNLTALSSGNPFNLNLWSLSSAEATTGDAQNFTSGGNFSWTIATAAGGITGFDSDDFIIYTAATNGTNGFTNDLTGGTFSLAVVDGNKLNLVYQQTSAVPEPSSHLALLGLLSAGLLTRRRKV
jgi:autotransporter-associated beta strand protein